MKASIRVTRRIGFTLIELLMVMVVLAVLAAIVIPKFSNRKQQASEAALKTDLSHIRGAIGSFQADTGYYPAQLSDLTATSAASLATADTGVDSNGNPQTFTPTDFHGPYLTTIPNDPVSGSAFGYSTTTVGQVASTASGTGLDGVAYSLY